MSIGANSSVERKPHASLDQASRLKKATKIEEILSSRVKLDGARVLDIGAGAGLIAEYFQRVVGPEGMVVAVDRVDQTGGAPPFEFRQVEDTNLPFEDESFDIVISNHVMEHVGPREDQLNHLSEIRRVLASDGIVYLAVPNRWALVEPHFRLPFLSWMPERMRSSYVRLAGRGELYDCAPPSRGDLVTLLAECGLRGTEVTLEALQIMARIEMSAALGRAVSLCPHGVLRLAMGLIPTLVMIVKKNESSQPAIPAFGDRRPRLLTPSPG